MVPTHYETMSVIICQGESAPGGMIFTLCAFVVARGVVEYSRR